MFGIDAQYYSHIYIWLVTALSIIVFQRYSTYPQSRLFEHFKRPSYGILLLMIALSFFIGLRPISGQYFLDMSGYASYYFVHSGDAFSFDWNATNVLFDNFILFFASHHISINVFFLSIAFIYFGGMAWACYNLFPRDRIAAFLVYLGAFSTFSYGTNGIKAGAAASLFLVALSLYENRKWLWSIIFLFFSIGFHHAMILPITAFIICLFVKKPQWFFLFWVLCLVLSLFHINIFQYLFANLVDESGSIYLIGDGENIRSDILGGFRLDFILYSVIPIAVGWIAVFRKHIKSKHYFVLLNLYTLTNAIWLLCMYAEFTNRIAYLSWLLYPIVLIYPLLNEQYSHNQYSSFKVVGFANIAFSLVLQYIY